MAKQTDINDGTGIAPTPTQSVYKVTFAYANDKGMIRNGSILQLATNSDDARERVRNGLKEEYQHFKILSVKNW